MFGRTCMRRAFVRGRRGTGYQGHDSYVCGPKRGKQYHKQPNSTVTKSPLAHKYAWEYPDNGNARVGNEWHLRYNRRGYFRGFPFKSWQDDPLRHHKTETSSRTFSARTRDPGDGMPLWDPYESACQDYRLPNEAAPHQLIPILNIHVGRVWGIVQMSEFLDLIVEEGWNTVEEVHESIDHIREWNDIFYKLPVGFVEHLALLTQDIVGLNKKKAWRCEMHSKGVLRTTDMVQYFAAPYFQGPPMPEKLAQAAGKPSPGKFTQNDLRNCSEEIKWGSWNYHALRPP